MRTVHKFLVPKFGDTQFTLKPPPPAPIASQSRIVHVGNDPRTHEPAIWAEMITEHEIEERGRVFAYFGTGDPIPAGWTHVGSMITVGGKYVWHVYEQVQR